MGPFDHAVANGVFFNQLKTAQKRVKDEIKLMNEPAYTVPRFSIEGTEEAGDGFIYYSNRKEFVQEESKQYDIRYHEFDLEVVPAYLTLNKPQ